MGTNSGGNNPIGPDLGRPPRRVGSSSEAGAMPSSEATRIVEPGPPQEHPFSNGDVFEKLGIPEVPGKLDSESSVDVTTSRSPCRTMVDV